MTIEEFRNLKVGDKVRIKRSACDHQWVDLMDEYDGQVLTIKTIYEDNNTFDTEEAKSYYYGYPWIFGYQSIESKQPSFKVGDRVRFIGPIMPAGLSVSNLGTIKNVEDGWYAVDFDKGFADGHTCVWSPSLGDVCKPRHGWFCRDKDLEKVDFEEELQTALAKLRVTEQDLLATKKEVTRLTMKSATKESMIKELEEQLKEARSVAKECRTSRCSGRYPWGEDQCQDIFEERLRNLKAGDTVRLKNRRGAFWNVYGFMDEFMGKTVTLSTSPFGSDGLFKIVGHNWQFNFDDIEEIVSPACRCPRSQCKK